MKLQGGCLSPVPEEIPMCIESIDKGKQDTLANLPQLKEHGMAHHQQTEKTKQAVYSENRFVPLVSEKQKSLCGLKVGTSQSHIVMLALCSRETCLD